MFSRGLSQPPRLPFHLLLYIIICLFLFTVYMIRINEPTNSLGNQPPNLYFNEGGSKCFGPNSRWQLLKNLQNNVSEVEDIFQLGGATPKSLLSFNGADYQAIWKPQMAYTDAHKDSSFFEVVYFHLDCLLELRKTPAAVSFNLPYNLLFSSLKGKSKKLYDDRHADWAIWRENNVIDGVAQYYVPDVKHLNVFVEKCGKFVRSFLDFFFIGKYLFSDSDFSIREYSQRDMIDYITGNWDRGHNKFYVVDPITGDTVLVYLDHNHLRLNLEERPFQLKYCKFWYQNVDLLGKSMELGLEKLVRESLERETIVELGLDDRFDNPVKCLDKRAREFMAHVDNCIQQHGFEYVFGFPREDVINRNH